MISCRLLARKINACHYNNCLQMIRHRYSTQGSYQYKLQMQDLSVVFELIFIPVSGIIDNVIWNISNDRASRMIWSWKRVCHAKSGFKRRAFLVTDDLKPRMTDDTFFRCGPNWLGITDDVPVETQRIASLPLYSLSPIIKIHENDWIIVCWTNSAQLLRKAK